MPVAVAAFGALAGAENPSSWTVGGLSAVYTDGLVVRGSTAHLEIRAGHSV